MQIIIASYVLVVRQIQQHEIEAVVNFRHGATFVEKVIVIFCVTLWNYIGK